MGQEKNVVCVEIVLACFGGRLSVRGVNDLCALGVKRMGCVMLAIGISSRRMLGLGDEAGPLRLMRHKRKN
jgi:hypothetical protein